MNWKIWLGGLALAAMGAAISAPTARAGELWDPELPGILEGLPAVALPPPGVYGQLDNYFAQFVQYDGWSNKIPNSSIDALVEVPAVLWVPGITVLGANYAAAIAVPFDYNTFQPFQDAHGGPGNLGLFNTALVPAMLSWMLPNHFFVRTSVTFFINDGTNTMADVIKGNLKNGGAPSSNDYSTFMPSVGVSWLNNGWNLSADFRFAAPLGSTTAPNYHYRTGDVVLVDYTMAKTVKRWTFGFGASQIVQLQKDTFNGMHPPGSIWRNYGIGPMVGYQFPGGIEAMVIWTHSVYTTAQVGGDSVDLRLSTRF
jgi:hypothetical protein